MGTFNHRLKRNKTSQFPAQHIALATVATAGRKVGKTGRTAHGFWAAAARRWRIQDGQTTRQVAQSFTAAGDVGPWIEQQLSRHRVTRLWSHQLATDWTLCDLWLPIEWGYWSLDWAVLEHRVTIISVTTPAGKLIALDLRQWLDADMAGLADLVGLPAPIGAGLEPPATSTMETAVAEVGIVAAAVGELHRFITGHDLGCFRFTAAGQSLQAYRHRFMAHDLMVHAHPLATRLERAAMFGEHTEPFRLGDIVPWGETQYPPPGPRYWRGLPPIAGPVHAVDVQSQYGAMMAARPMPIALAAYHDSPTKTMLEDALAMMACVAEVRLATARQYPVRQADGSVAYAIGQYTTTLAGDELAQAVAAGEVRQVYQLATYRAELAFTDYVGAFWGWRQLHLAAGQPVMAALCNHFLRSLHGKFGQRLERWKETPKIEPLKRWGPWTEIDHDTGEVVLRRGIAGLTQTKESPAESRDSMPAIAACTTAAARMQMRGLRALAGHCSVHYQAADMLLVDEVGFGRLCTAGKVRQGELGALRLKTTALTGQIRGPKDYTLDGRLTVAGLPAGSREIEPGLWRVPKQDTAAGLAIHQPDGEVRRWDEIVRYDHNYGADRLRLDGWLNPVILGGRVPLAAEVNP